LGWFFYKSRDAEDCQLSSEPEESLKGSPSGPQRSDPANSLTSDFWLQQWEKKMFLMF
jgi:hypothetical protein